MIWLQVGFLYSVSTEICPIILYAETAAQIWSNLKDRFSQSNAPKIYQLKQSISALKQEGKSVSLYFTQLKSLWDELNSIAPVNQCICQSMTCLVTSFSHELITFCEKLFQVAFDLELVAFYILFQF